MQLINFATGTRYEGRLGTISFNPITKCNECNGTVEMFDPRGKLHHTAIHLYEIPGTDTWGFGIYNPDVNF